MTMLLLARVDWLHYVFAIPMILLSIFLVLVILVQRGRGGGLTGALGGMGGQSAFGTKAGDLFTRITIVVAALWVLLSMASIKVLTQRQALNPNLRGQPNITAPADGKAGTMPAPPAGKTPSTTTPTTPPPTSPLPAAPASTAPAPTPPAGKTP
jgi:preprotein translocase subunit SecG